MDSKLPAAAMPLDDPLSELLRFSGKEPGISDKLFDILKEQKEGLLALKKTYGSIVTPSQLEEF